MGLDQYAYSIKGEEQTEIAYWRKHNRLQGWMEELYRNKGGKEEFNCKDIELTLEDLDDLSEAVVNRKLPETQGFFFGEDSYKSPELLKEREDRDYRFICDARQAIRDGNKVIYTCWW